jgi:hypothetical protein
MLHAQLIAEALRKRLLDVRTESLVRLRGFLDVRDQQFADQVVVAITPPQIRTPLAAYSLSGSAPASVVAGLSGLEGLRQTALGETVGVPEKLMTVPFDRIAFMQLTAARRFVLLAELELPYSITLPSQEWLREELLRQAMVSDRKKLEDRQLGELHHDFMLLKLNLLALVAGVHGDLRYLDAVNYWYERLPVRWKPTGDHQWLLASLVGIYAQALCITASWRPECA